MSFDDIKRFFIDIKLKKIKEKKSKEELEKYLLNCSNPKDVVDRLDASDLKELSIDVYAIKIPGYYNLYDYILKTKNTSILVNDSDINNPNIFIPWILNKKSVDYLKVTDELLMTILPNGEKIIE